MILLSQVFKISSGIFNPKCKLTFVQSGFPAETNPSKAGISWNNWLHLAFKNLQWMPVLTNENGTYQWLIVINMADGFTQVVERLNGGEGSKVRILFETFSQASECS